MFNGLEFFTNASALAQHSARRQSIIARNVANADTPNFKAQDLEAFSAPGGKRAQRGQLLTTSPGHLTHSRFMASREVREQVVPGDASPNGNTVSIETEMIRASEARQRHDLAVATYRNGLDLLRTAIGRR